MLPTNPDLLRCEKMSTVDTAWLRMDSEGNLMMIVSVLMFDRPLDMPRFRLVLQKKLLAHHRFRSRVVQDVAGAWWQEQEINLDQHILHCRLPARKTSGNKAELEKLVGLLAATPLDPAQPLWQMHIVDNCLGEEGRTRQAVIVRIHHCIADGIALVGLLLSMFDGSREGSDDRIGVPEDEQESVESADELGNESADTADNPWDVLLQPITKGAIGAINLSASWLTRYLATLAESDQLVERLVGMATTAGQFAQDAIKLLTMEADSPTRLKGQPHGIKHVAWSEPLPLAEIKVIGQALRSSINDVLMSCVAGAVGAYLRAKGDNIAEHTESRVMVPVHLRKSSRQEKLGNAFGLVPLVLPVGIDDPIARLHEVRRRMNELKEGYQAMVAMVVLGILGATPRQVQNEIHNYFASKASAVMSNVPGPQAPLYLAGSQLDQIMFWVPQSGNIGVGVSVLSYNGGVQLGIVTDDNIARDPHQIIKRFAPEFEKLVLLALMSEW